MFLDVLVCTCRRFLSLSFLIQVYHFCLLIFCKRVKVDAPPLLLLLLLWNIWLLCLVCCVFQWTPNGQCCGAFNMLASFSERRFSEKSERAEWRQRKEDATANWWLVPLKRRAFNQSEQRHQTEETAHDDDDHDASRHFNITDSDVEQGKLYSFFSFFTLSLSLWCHRQCRLETSTTHIIPPFWPNCPFLISFFPSFYRSKFCFDF